MVYGADINRIDTWYRYRKGLCDGCMAGCCNLPAEARVQDLLRMGLVDAFEAEGPLKDIARRLMKAGVVGHFNAKDAMFTLARHSSGDCIYLDRNTRRCTIYDKRPDTCRNHPAIGPRPGFCAWQPKK
ncbi:MAG TPA: YkgJ family cysteine cluster protein [Pseudomonadales bacterium]|nr:YkgJ family cysteine cluster protein [Pseudomonadales bacterium]